MGTINYISHFYITIFLSQSYVKEDDSNARRH